MSDLKLKENGEENISLKNEETVGIPKSRLNRILVFLGVGYMMSYAAYGGVLTLESSMNVEEGLGTASVSTIFVASSISGLFFVPFLIDKFGAKTSLIAGQFGFLVYIVANFYPSWYTLIPAAIFHGLSESAPWAGSSVYVTFLGERSWVTRSKRKTERTKESYIYRDFSYFYIFVFAGELLGSGIVWFILFLMKDVGKTETFEHVSNNETTHENKEINYTICGANDCQADYIYNSTESDLSQYQPNVAAVYTLLSIFTIMSLINMGVECWRLPRVPAKYDALYESKVNKYKVMWDNYVIELKHVFYHVISPLHLFFVLPSFYYGVYYGYVLTEYTRAYVSCAVGVEQVGIAICIYAMSSGITLSVTSWLVPKIGRRWLAVVMTTFHAISYLVSLFWQPMRSSTWVIYLLAVIFGICEALVLNVIQGLTALHFEDRLGIAFSVKNCVTNLGIVLVTAYSTSLCVYVKLYLQIGFLFLSALGLIGGEVLYTRKLNVGKIVVDTINGSEL